MRQALRILISLAGAGATLAAGAWAGGAARAQKGHPPRATEELGYEHRRGEIAVGDALEVNGQPMQLSLFYTQDAPRQVALFYARGFEARGVTPIVSADDRLAHVAGFDRRDGLQRFITAVPQADGQTLVLIGVTDPRRPPKLSRGSESAGFPVPAENRAYLGYRSSDLGAEAESGQFVSTLQPAELLGFYRREMPSRGWSERNGDASASMAVFSKGAQVLSVAVQALDAKAGSAVFVNRTAAR